MRFKLLLVAALSAVIVVAACGQNSPIANGGADAGQGGGGGMDVDAAACATSCNGCCNANGVCVAASNQDNTGCGSGGNLCAPCVGNQTCSAGTCHDFSCQGCVTPSGSCNDAGLASDIACGANGVTCKQCLNGSTCVNGFCTPDCAGKVYDAGTYDWTLVHDGKTRSFRVHVPAKYDRSKKTPLVFNFHGFTSYNTQQEDISQMTPVADREGFIVIYANGLTGAEAGGIGSVRSWNAGACCGTSMQNDIDDVGFVVKMIDLAADRFCIDSKRVYSTGFSNGGFLSHRLACERADRIAAIGPVAAVNGMPSCNPKRNDAGVEVPIMHFHGTADTLVPYNGNATFVSVRSSMDSWALRNGCSANPQTTSTRGDVKCERYPSCANGADTELCTVFDGGHSWPGGSDIPFTYTTRAVKASEDLWQFFKAHPMP